VRLATFLPPDARDAVGGPRVQEVARTSGRTGLVVGDEIVDLTHPAVGLPAEMPALLGLGQPALDAAATAPATTAARWNLDDIGLLAPVPIPPKVLAIGMNYGAHVAELGREPPAYQYWFNKQRTCIVGPGHPIEVPPVSVQVDYEGELGLVVGAYAKDVPADRWLDVIAGFTVVNDVSVRDWQWRTPTFTMGKSFDTHGPTGPFLVTPGEIGDPGALGIRTWVDGDLRQDSTTADLLFGFGAMIEYLTTVFPLEPGDVIATGTPAGIGASFDPPRWLRPGDTVRIEIEGVGTLENPVAAA
jgi:2-keto-4-pentenoate hydratase/2-oxohepta-3-ene-1,7-dioic acid hydratase in catechol pathway